ncbi:MAG: diaminopimelate decarboxylase [Candidatus Bathyarchaeia archaeon]
MDRRFRGPLGNQDGILTIGGVAATELVENYGTPLYVTDESTVRSNFRLLKEAFEQTYGEVRIYYSMKANSNISILRILLDEGSFLDSTSTGEIFLGLKAGFPPHRILYTGTSVSNEDLKFAVEMNVTINVDSRSQFERLMKIKVPELISVRLNPGIGSGHHRHVITGGVGSKFGLPHREALDVYRMAKARGVAKFGFHMHIGSGILAAEPYLTALKNLLDLVVEAKNTIGVKPEFIDIGGGLGVPYRPEDPEFPLNEFAFEVSSLIKKYDAQHDLGGPVLCVEPGRFIVCDSTVLLTKINDVKMSEDGMFIGVDAGFNTLIRPAMYGSYHEILPASKLNESATHECCIVGPLCESGDVFGRYRMPQLSEGDLLAILNAGAYGFSMSSQYNARPRSAEVLVKNGNHEVIREREVFDDLLKGQRVANWLK